MVALSPYVNGRWRPEGKPAAAPTIAMQGSLLDLAEEPEFGSLGSTVERIPLTHGAWVDVRRSWVTGADLLFERLRDSASWQAERRQMYDRAVNVPRLNCYLRAEDVWPDQFLHDLRDALNAHYVGDPFVTCGMAYYRDGRDSVAWHGDTLGRGSTHDVMVAIVSTGTVRAFSMRPRGGGPSMKFDVGHGDLLVMGGSAQRTWEHAVLKTAKPCGPRISIQFRPHEVG
jgi:alkylated DNA repair dioxygenase AlkB